MPMLKTNPDSVVFAGENALYTYLNPQNHPMTPLVELPASLNPYASHKVRIFAKMMGHTPLMNVKSLPAFSMIDGLRKQNELENCTRLIENSSGNTVFSLAIIGRALGINTTQAFVSNEISDGKLKMLRLFGVEPIVNNEPICPDPNDPTSGIHKARKMAQEDPSLTNPGQYENPCNPNAHYEITGPQLWKQTQGNLSIFCAGLGTTGTMVGTSNYLKGQNAAICCIGVVRAKNNPVPGPRTRGLLQEIAFDWRTACDDIQEVGTVDSYRTSLQLCRHGILGGPSSGFNLKGLCQFLDAQIASGNLEQYRNIHGEILSAFIVCDAPFIYLNEYFEYLEESDFPQIHNKELLDESTRTIEKCALVSVPEVTPNEAFSMMFEPSSSDVWKALKSGEPITQNNVLVVDVRRADDYVHFHIPDSINIPMDELQQRAGEINQEKKTVIVVCTRGNTSLAAAEALITRGLHCYSMSGGMMEWSRLDLPRVRPNVCAVRDVRN